MPNQGVIAFETKNTRSDEWVVFGGGGVKMFKFEFFRWVGIHKRTK